MTAPIESSEDDDKVHSLTVRARKSSSDARSSHEHAAAWLASVVRELPRTTLPPPEAHRQSPTFEGDFDPVANVAWQRLWLATQRAEWSSIVLVPAGADFSTYRSARALAAVGGQHLGRPVEAFNATVLELGGLAGGLELLARRGRLGRRSIVALPSVLDNPIALAIAQAADAALVCLRLGDRLDDAEHTVAEIGAAKVLGVAIVHGRDDPR